MKKETKRLWFCFLHNVSHIFFLIKVNEWFSVLIKSKLNKIFLFSNGFYPQRKRFQYIENEQTFLLFFVEYCVLKGMLCSCDEPGAIYYYSFFFLLFTANEQYSLGNNFRWYLVFQTINQMNRVCVFSIAHFLWV